MVLFDGPVLAPDRQAEVVPAADHHTFDYRLSAVQMWGLICQIKASGCRTVGPETGP